MGSVTLLFVEMVAHSDSRSRLKNYPSGVWKKKLGKFSNKIFYFQIQVSLVNVFPFFLLKITVSEPLTEPIIFEHTISSVGNVETGLKIGMKILTINEIEICNLKHSDIAKLLKKR